MVCVGAKTTVGAVSVICVLSICVTVATLVEVAVIVMKLTAVEVVLSVLYEVTVCVPTRLRVDVAITGWVEVGVIVLSFISHWAIARCMMVLHCILRSNRYRYRRSLGNGTDAGWSRREDSPRCLDTGAD